MSHFGPLRQSAHDMATMWTFSKRIHQVELPLSLITVFLVILRGVIKKNVKIAFSNVVVAKTVIASNPLHTCD